MLKGKFSSRRRVTEEVDAMSGLANLSDVMLVFACGLMAAVILNWNVAIPVDVTLTFSPPRYPVYVTNSRLSATSSASSRYFAIALHRFGSPGMITYRPIKSSFTFI